MYYELLRVLGSSGSNEVHGLLVHTYCYMVVSGYSLIIFMSYYCELSLVSSRGTSILALVLLFSWDLWYPCSSDHFAPHGIVFILGDLIFGILCILRFLLIFLLIHSCNIKHHVHSWNCVSVIQLWNMILYTVQITKTCIPLLGFLMVQKKYLWPSWRLDCCLEYYTIEVVNSG